MRDFFLELINKRPSVGYLASATSTTAGFWVLVEKLTRLGALISVIVGIGVGLVTFAVQFKNLRKRSD